MTLALRNWAFGSCLWLALLTVFALALDPFGPPTRETSGSAFSFFTSDVSLGPTRAPAPRSAAELRDAPDLASGTRGGSALQPAHPHLPLPRPLAGPVVAAPLPPPFALPPLRLAGSIQARAPPAR